MKKRSTRFLCGAILGIFFSLAGGERAVVAAPPVAELVGTVEQKNRAPLPQQVQHEEPGNLPDRPDRATSIVAEGNKMFITLETVVKNTDGKDINFNDVFVPCQARILYQQLPDGNRNVLELDIQRVLSGASNAWPSPTPN